MIFFNKEALKYLQLAAGKPSWEKIETDMVTHLQSKSDMLHKQNLQARSVHEPSLEIPGLVDIVTLDAAGRDSTTIT